MVLAIAPGVEPRQLRRIYRRQLSSTAVAVVVTGLVAGVGLAALITASFAADVPRRWLVLSASGVAVAAGVLVWLGAVLATWLLSGAIRDATDLENLRAA